jgi:hypothetical protein
MKKLYLIVLIAILSNPQGYAQKRVKTIAGPKQLCSSICFSNDGKLLYLGSFDKMIWVIDISTSKVTDTLKFHKGPVTAMDMSSENTLASAGWDGKVGLWKSGSSQPSLTLDGHVGKVTGVQFSPDGTKLASVGDDGKLIIWDATSGGKINEVIAHKEPITSVSFKNDGSMLATTSWDKTILIWNIYSDTPIATFYGHNALVNHVSFSSQDFFMVSAADDNSMIVWHVQAQAQLRKYDFYKKPLSKALFINKDDHIISFDNDGEIKVYNRRNHQLLSVTKAHKGKILAVAWFNKQSLLATAGEDLEIHLWDLSDYTYFECLKSKTAKIEHLSKPKGEFETTEQYERRIADFEKRKASLLDECKKETELELIAIEKMKLEKAASQYSYVQLSVKSIGTFDADKTLYPITIESQTYQVKMSIEDAIAFKDNWQKAKVKVVRKDIGNNNFQYFNIELEHPTTKTIYKLGEQLSENSNQAFKLFLEKHNR